MTLQEQYDEAMFSFSQGDFRSAVEKLEAVLKEDPAHFEARLALGMSWYRLGEYATAIAEGHKAEKLQPHEQLVHTNLSLFYMKSGDKVTAEHHGLQARIASWRTPAVPNAAASGDPELELAKPPPPPPVKFPETPWKKKQAEGTTPKQPGHGH